MLRDKVFDFMKVDEAVNDNRLAFFFFKGAISLVEMVSFSLVFLNQTFSDTVQICFPGVLVLIHGLLRFPNCVHSCRFLPVFN